MRRRTLRHLLLARLGRPDDDTGTIAMLLLVMMLTVSLGGVMLSAIITQSHDTRFSQSRVHSLDAAQSGVDFVIGRIRSSISAPGDGDAARLPCGPWRTRAADNNATLNYSAWVTYFTRNPASLTASQVGTPDHPGTAAMLCAPGSGPYDPVADTRTPRYALITSTGTDTTAGDGGSIGRSLQTTYVFTTNDVNVSGGQIRIYPNSASQWCMDAGTTPAAGTVVRLQACSTSNPPIDSQVWTYRADLSIELVSTATTPTPLCIDTNPTAHTAGASVVLQRCAVPDTAVCPAGSSPSQYSHDYPGRTCAVSPYNQQWSVDDNAHLQGANSGQTDLDGYCIDVSSQAADVPLTLQGCVGSVSDTRQTWVPSPTTGAGMAGAGNQQLVNYKQFATCLDVTGQDPNASYLILYTCKQNPDPTRVAWNQKFEPVPDLGAGPTDVLLTATKGGVTYCLRSPLVAGGYPVLSTPCPAGPTGAFRWTVSQKYTTDAKTAELSYARKYTITDSSPTPLCLGPGANDDFYNGQYYKAVVTTCDGSTAQKWNADPSLDISAVTNVREVTVTAGN